MKTLTFYDVKNAPDLFGLKGSGYKFQFMGEWSDPLVLDTSDNTYYNYFDVEEGIFLEKPDDYQPTREDVENAIYDLQPEGKFIDSCNYLSSMIADYNERYGTPEKFDRTVDEETKKLLQEVKGA